ncbi:hypothetical protein GBF38_000055, partial [Nibea albiflora]
MRTGSQVMREGPAAVLPVQQQPNRHINPEAGCLFDLQGRVPLLTQNFSSKLGTMSEPVPLQTLSSGSAGQSCAEMEGAGDGHQVIFANESSDGRESSSSTTEVGEGDDDDDEEDDFPEMLQYKEFLKPTNEGKPEFIGSQEEQDTPQNNGKQAAACESMTLLMKKLDHLNGGIQENINCSHADGVSADEEHQSAAVSSSPVLARNILKCMSLL